MKPQQFLLFVMTLVLLSTPATAKHPVREMGVVVVRVHSEIGYPSDTVVDEWTTSDMIQRQVEFANRVYANAGIHFTFDPEVGFLDIWNDDLNCWADDMLDDEATANFLGDTNQDYLVSLVHFRMAQAVGKPCVYSHCQDDHTCCPDAADWDPAAQRCRYLVGCRHYPDWPAAPFGVCGPTGSEAAPPACYTYSCIFGSCFCVPVSCEVNWNFLRLYPMAGNVYISLLAHEAGHHFGLWHTFDAPLSRCYDVDEGEVPVDCGGGVAWPNTEPASCYGTYGTQDNCPVNTPYRNIMSYFAICQTRYAGQDAPGGSSDWNTSLSPEQIQIIWRVINEVWDRDVQSSGDERPYELGGWENLQAALSTGTTEYRGLDSWATVLSQSVGDAGWTKGNLRLTPGDFNGDGHIDLIAVTPTGPHAGVSLWLRTASMSLYYSATLLAGSGFGSNAIVTAGNFEGDMADDVVVQSASSFLTFRGAVGGTTMSYQPQNNKSWPHTTHKVVIGDFAGDYALSTPMPAGETYVWMPRHQLDAVLGTWNNISHDDIAVFGPTTFDVYKGDSELDLSLPYYWSPAWPQTGAWAGNVADDYHDELLVRIPDYVRVIRGQEYFTPWSMEPSIFVGSADPVLVSMGDFTGDFHADFFLTSHEYGTQLYYGGAETHTLALLNWSHLNPSNIRHVAADFIRGGKDDVMLSANWGSFLYAGLEHSPHMVGSVWSNASLTRANAEWFGRR